MGTSQVGAREILKKAQFLKYDQSFFSKITSAEKNTRRKPFVLRKLSWISENIKTKRNQIDEVLFQKIAKC